MKPTPFFEGLRIAVSEGPVLDLHVGLWDGVFFLVVSRPSREWGNAL